MFQSLTISLEQRTRFLISLFFIRRVILINIRENVSAKLKIKFENLVLQGDFYSLITYSYYFDNITPENVKYLCLIAAKQEKNKPC